jgi:ubiquinone/menaquinone biosynthesis C-methylase UbiE
MSSNLIDCSYEPFSREPEYIEVNRRFLKGLGLDASGRILDLACGTGTLTELLLRETNGRTRSRGNEREEAPLDVIALDLSAGSLELARKRLVEITLVDWPNQLPSSVMEHEKRIVDFVQASADCLPLVDRSVQAVIMGNAIQLLDDKSKFLDEVDRVLSPGGVFAFNTSFYAGTFPSGTEHFYVRWVQDAVSYLQQKDQELKRSGLPGISRRRGLAKPAFSQRWLSRGEYERLLEQHGFKIKSVKESTVLLTQHSFETIGSYAGLASVLLSGYPVDSACEALEKSAGPALDAVGMEVVPRYWIEFVASKRMREH